MKELKDMTDQEILALTEEDISKMEKIKMAEEGIKILDMPKTPDYIKLPSPSVLAYSIGKTELFTLNQETATKIIQLFKELEDDLFDDSYNSDYSLKYLVPANKKENYSKTFPYISTENFYTREVAYEIAESKKANDRMEKEYNQLKKDYQESYSQAEYIRAEINDKYWAVKKEYADYESMYIRYKEYIELANGNTETAMIFLKKAYTITEKCELYITSKTN